MPSAVLLLEVLHKGYESVDALHRERVVDRSADTADRAVTLQRAHSGGLGLFDELLLERFVAVLDAPGDVHERTIFLNGGARPEVARIDHVVNLAGLLDVELEEVLLAHLLDPLHRFAEDVDTPGRRSVVKGILLRVGAVLEHRGDVFRALLREVVADCDDSHTGRTEVLLGAGVEHGELVVVALAAEDVGRHVADQRNGNVGNRLHLGARNRLVRADVGVGGAFGPVEGVGLTGRNILLAVGDDVHGSAAQSRDLLGLLDGLVGPCAGVDVVGDLTVAEEIHGDHAELHGRAALDKADGPVVVKAAKLLERGDRLLMDGVVILAAVGHFHYGHSRTLVINEILLSVLKDFERKRRGTGGEIISACHF